MKRLFPIILCAVVIATHSAKATATNTPPLETRGYDKGLETYVKFLKERKQSPVDYVLSLFKHYDLVVLCERAHAEVTQYDLFYAVVSDRRFTGHYASIFTEIGSVALRPYVDSLLTDGELNDEQVDAKLRYIARHIGHDPVWEKSNYYHFLRRLYRLNRTLPQSRRVHLYPSDLNFDWKNATSESYAQFKSKELAQRDEIMADNIISRFNEIWRVNPRAKALVIMNYRHAFPDLTNIEQNTTFKNTGGFLMAAYPGKVANVMINSVAPLSSAADRQASFTAIQDGKWDAAFAVLGNPDIGFDFKNSPFGKDSFDYFPFFKTGWTYERAFTGFVFFQPLERHRMSIGLPGLFDDAFLEEILRRYGIMGENVSDAEMELFRGLGTLHAFGYDEKSPFLVPSDYREKIRQWLKDKP